MNQEQPLKLLARRLRLALRSARISQRECCRRIDISPTTMQYWLSGKKEPGAVLLYELSRVLGVDMNYFFDIKASSEHYAQIEKILPELQRVLNKIKF